jgi:hypothetical protein
VKDIGHRGPRKLKGHQPSARRTAERRDRKVPPPPQGGMCS